MLDVIITSSCRRTITKTIHSFLEKVRYSGKYRFVINIDVLNAKYLSALQDFLKEVEISSGATVEVRVNPDPAKNWYEAHVKAISYLYSRIESPYYFHLEDDWVFLKEIDLDQLQGLMQKYPYIDHIRFSKEKIKDKTWLYHLSDEISEDFLVPNHEVSIDGIPLVQSPVWSFNPHIGRTSIIKKFINIPENQNPEKHICHKYPVIVDHCGIYISGKIGDGPSVQDIGRNRIREKLLKLKYIISGGEYADYLFG